METQNVFQYRLKTIGHNEQPEQGEKLKIN